MEVFDLTRPKKGSARSQPRRIFTLDHANRTLPLVSRIVADMVRQYKKVCALEDRCHIRRPSVSNEEHSSVRRAYEVELDKLRDLSEELSAVGCELKDWRRGLVDFHAVLNGKKVELCWRLGEERIEFWHEVGAGFTSRQPLDAELTAALSS